MKIVISLLAIVGAISIYDHMSGGEKSCLLCRISNIKKEDIAQLARKVKGEDEKHGTRYGSNPIHY